MNKDQNEINREVHEALYGIDGQPGIIQHVNEMAQILSAFKLFGRTVMWIALFLGSVGTAIEGILTAIKFYLKHK